MADKEKINLETKQLPEGTVLEADAFEVGQTVFVVSGEDRTPAPEGSYTLDDGMSINVDSEGVITEVAAEGGEVAPEEETTAGELPKEQEMQEPTKPRKIIESTTTAKETQFSTEAEAQNEDTMNKEFETKLASQSEELEAMKKKLENMEAPRTVPSPAKVELATQRSAIGGHRMKGRSIEERIRNFMFNLESLALNPNKGNEIALTKEAIELATTVNITSTYAGEWKDKWITAMLLSNNTIAEGGIMVNTQIKYKEPIKRLSLTDIVQDANCDFTPTGTLGLTERYLEPKELEAPLQLCKKDFRSDWYSEAMGYSVWDNLAPTFQDFLLLKIAAVIGNKMETNIWTGDKANSGEFDGLLTRAKTDAAVIDVTSSAITKANVIEEIGKVYDAIPNEILNEDGTMIYISNAIAKAYRQALAGFGTGGLGANGVNGEGPLPSRELSYAGVPIFVANGMPAGEMLAANKNNLWFGTGILDDITDVKVKDMADVDLSQNVRMAARFTGDANYGISEEVVYYWANV